MVFLDLVCESSKLRDVKTSQKVIFFLLQIIIIFIFDNISISIISFITLFIVTLLFLEESYNYLIKLLTIPLLFLVTGLLPILFQINSNDVLWCFQLFNVNLGITQESLQLATLTLFKALSIVLCSYFLILNTRMNNIFNFMHTIKVPLLIINLFELTYRFIYIFIDRTITLKHAQDARLGYVNFKRGINSFALMMKNIFINAFTNLTKTRNAMDSRLYDSEINYYISNEFFSIKFQLFYMLYLLFIVMIGCYIDGYF